MIITDYTNDEISLRCVALHVAHEFSLLKRIGDVKWVPIWNYYIPQVTIVREFWHYLAEALKESGDAYGICRADIQYETHQSTELQYDVDPHNINEVDSIITTGIRLERITEVAKRMIDEETLSRQK